MFKRLRIAAVGLGLLRCDCNACLCTGHSAHRHDSRRHSPDDGPARPGLRRLSLRRLHDLRRAGELGPVEGRHHRRHQARSRHRMAGGRRRRQALDLQAAPGRQVSRRLGLRCRCRGLEPRKDPERQVAAVRSQAGGPGAAARPDAGRLEGHRQVHGRAHDPHREFAVPLRHVLHLLFEPRPTGRSRARTGSRSRCSPPAPARSRSTAWCRASAWSCRASTATGTRAACRSSTRSCCSRCRRRRPAPPRCWRARSTGSRCRRPTPSRASSRAA